MIDGISVTGKVQCTSKLHGEVYTYNNTTAQSVTTSYVALANYTAAGSTNVGVSSIYASGSLRADVSGLYKVTFTATIFNSSTSTLFSFGVHNEGVLQQNMVQEINSYGNGNVIQNITISGYTQVIAGDFVNVKVKSIIKILF